MRGVGVTDHLGCLIKKICLFLLLPIVLCEQVAFFACVGRQERWRGCFFLCYLSPSGGQSAPGNMPPSSVSGCCFASAVAYLL